MWCLWHWLTHHNRECLVCPVLTAEAHRKAEGLWLPYVCLAWFLLLAGIMLGR